MKSETIESKGKIAAVLFMLEQEKTPKLVDSVTHAIGKMRSVEIRSVGEYISSGRILW